jgi:hypothetical protein
MIVMSKLADALGSELGSKAAKDVANQLNWKPEKLLEDVELDIETQVSVTSYVYDRFGYLIDLGDIDRVQLTHDDVVWEEEIREGT